MFLMVQNIAPLQGALAPPLQTINIRPHTGAKTGTHGILQLAHLFLHSDFAYSGTPRLLASVPNSPNSP